MTFFITTRKFMVGVLTAIFCVTSASAATLFDNGLPNTANGYSILGPNETRDDFTLLNTANIRHVTFYFQNYDGITGWNQNITYNIWDARIDGNLLASGAGANVTPVDSGLPWCCGGGNAWRVDFDLQADFTAVGGQTYWLGLSGATGSSSAWWVTTDRKNGMASQGGILYDTDFAFSLSDDGSAPLLTEPVPVDNMLTLTLLALLLAGLGWVGIRRI